MQQSHKLTHPIDRNTPVAGNKNGSQIQEAIPYKFDYIDGVKEFSWIYGLDNYHRESTIVDLRLSPLTVELPRESTTERIVILAKILNIAIYLNLNEGRQYGM